MFYIENKQKQSVKLVRGFPHKMECTGDSQALQTKDYRVYGLHARDYRHYRYHSPCAKFLNIFSYKINIFYVVKVLSCF